MADISIVTISFNQAKYLRSCIESVLNQDGANINYLVIDPGSTDGSREIIESYGNKLSYSFEKDCGPADGLRRGFLQTTAPLCGFLNSDDVLLPGALKSVVSKFNDNPDVGLISGGGYIIDGNGIRLKKVYSSKFRAIPYAFGAVTVFQQSTFFRFSDYLRTQGFNIRNKTCWDAELFLDLVLAGTKSRRFFELWSEFRIHAHSISGSGQLSQDYKLDSARLFRKVLGRPEKPIDVCLKLLFRSAKILDRIQII